MVCFENENTERESEEEGNKEDNMNNQNSY